MFGRAKQAAEADALERAMDVARAAMADDLAARGITDPAVLDAMRRVRRHRFFPEPMREPAIAYGDFPFPIGWGATISQPYIVAYMTQRLALRPGDRVLEIGAGSGYQAAVLAAVGARVWSLDVVPELADHARRVLSEEGFPEAQVRCADGYDGWREEAPFDAIVATCAPREVPEALVTQLADGGRLLLPVGGDMEFQQLVLVRREGSRVRCEADLPVRFVPMVHVPGGGLAKD